MEWFYVKVQISPRCWMSDRFSSEERCREFFAKHPIALDGFPYRWEAISEDEYRAMKYGFGERSKCNETQPHTGRTGGSRN